MIHMFMEVDRIRFHARDACVIVLCALLLLPSEQHGGVHALKIKMRLEETIYKEFEQYESFYGSFVALPDKYMGMSTFDLTITSPSGVKVHEVLDTSEDKFHIVPYETGKYKFAIRSSQSGHPSRQMMVHEVLWDLHSSALDHTHTHMNNDDTEGLWHFVSQVDGQIQQLRSTQQYLYWRERRHRMTVESTNKRVLWYALLRCGVLLLTGSLQVVAVRRMFAK